MTSLILSRERMSRMNQRKSYHGNCFLKNKSGLNCCVYGDFNTLTTTSLETFDISLY